MAIPSGATVTVRLLDVSRMDVAAEVLGETTIPDPPNVPVPFSIPYNPGDIVDTDTHAVVARIHVDGELWWTSPEQHPVLTGGDPDTVEVRVDRVAGTGEAASEEE